MIKILFLVFLFNCNKLGFNRIDSNYKYPIDNKLIDAIRKAENDKIERIIKNITEVEHINITDLRYENKNFLMVLLQNYGISYQAAEGQEARNLVKAKIEIFNKYLPDFISVINDSDSNSKTLIFYAIDTGIGEIVTSLIDTKGIDLEHLNKDGISPLNYCILNETSIFNYLYNKNITVDSTLKYITKFKMSKSKKIKGLPPLLAACMANKPDIVKKLLAQGIEVDIENEYDTKAIWIAATKGHEEVVEELLLRGAKHLSRKSIILDKVQTVMGVAIKAFLQKSIDLGIAGANVIAKAHGVETGIPFGIDLKAFESSSHSDIDKPAAYKEVRRIYKRGNWITKVNKEELNAHIISEYVQLLSDIVNKIQKKYLEMKDIYKNNKNIHSIVKKIHAIDKMNQENLCKDLIEVQEYVKNLHRNIFQLTSTTKKDDKDLEVCLMSFQELLAKFLTRYERDKNILQPAYSVHNLAKDKSFSTYLEAKGIVSFHQLEALVNKTIKSLIAFIKEDNYKKITKYLHDNFQRRTRIDESVRKRNEKISKKAKSDIKRAKNYIKREILHTEKVSKINALLIKDEEGQEIPKTYIFIEGNIKYEKIDLSKEIENIEIPDINFNDLRQDHYDVFIANYKELLEKKEALFNFIDNEIE